MLDTSPTESKEPLSNPQDQKLPIDRHAGFHRFLGSSRPTNGYISLFRPPFSASLRHSAHTPWK